MSVQATLGKRIAVDVVIGLAIAAVLGASAIVVRAPGVETEVRNLRTDLQRIEQKLDAVILKR